MITEVLEDMENRLWDLITEFHFLLRDMHKWEGDDIVLQDKLRRLHAKLRAIVLEITLDCARKIESLQGGD